MPIRFSERTKSYLHLEPNKDTLISAVMATLVPHERGYRTTGFAESLPQFWADFDWTQFDTSVPKPSYTEALRIWEAWRRRGVTLGGSERFIGAASIYFDRMPLDHSVLSGIYTGSGLEHMPAAIHLLSAGADAGVHHPRMVMRNGDHVTGELWTRKHAEELLNALAARTNWVESAKNALVARYRTEFSALTAGYVVGKIPTQAELDTNKAKFDELLARLTPEKIEAEFRAEMDKLADETALPGDFDTARDVLIERLEATAMRRVKEIKGVVSQQGVDLPSSCADEDKAVTEVAKLQRLGAISLRNAADAAALKIAYDDAVEVIGAVSPLNTPVWEDGEGNALTGELAVTMDGPFNIRAKHPAADIPGEIAVIRARDQGDAEDPAGAAFKPSVQLNNDDSFKHLRVRITPPDTAGETATFKLAARNLCGLSPMLAVKVTRAAATPVTPAS